ncbi:MAG: hypothetical protein K0S80_718 [Neobacillus sp.]|nr:hypothetical protein [Neobacillus sp.]
MAAPFIRSFSFQPVFTQKQILGSAGYSLSDSDIFDLVIQFCLEKKYIIFMISIRRWTTLV